VTEDFAECIERNHEESTSLWIVTGSKESDGSGVNGDDERDDPGAVVDVVDIAEVDKTDGDYDGSK